MQLVHGTHSRITETTAEENGFLNNKLYHSSVEDHSFIN